MKVPIEFIGSDVKVAFEVDDIYVPPLPLEIDTNSDKAIIATYLKRAEAAEQSLKDVESFILYEIEELGQLIVDEAALDNSELLKMLDVLRKVVNDLTDHRLLLAQAINSYINLNAGVTRFNAEAELVEQKSSRINQKLKDELEILRLMIETVSRSRAYYNSLDVGLLELVNDATGEKIDDIIRMLRTAIDTVTSYRNRADALKISIIGFENLLDTYECWANQLKTMAERLLALYKSLYVRARALWLRLISGSYIRTGENVHINRECTTLIISAVRPPLTECEPTRFLDRPPPTIDMPPSQKQDCPPCIPNPSPDPGEPPKQDSLPTCEIEFLDHNKNKLKDDDLELYINGKAVKVFKGTVQALTTYTIEVPSGAVKLEMKFYKSNNTNTVKQIEGRYKGGAQIFYEKMSCPSSTEKGKTIWSKTINVNCGSGGNKFVAGEENFLNSALNNLRTGTGLVDSLSSSNHPEFAIFVGSFHRETGRFEYAYTYTKEFVDAPLGQQRLQADKDLVRNWSANNSQFEYLELTDIEEVRPIWNSRVGDAFFYRRGK